MAMEAKASFLNMMEKRLRTEVSAEMMTRMMSICADVLEGFQMMECRQEDDGQDDLLDSFIAALTVQGRSQKTIDRYAYVLNRMLADLGVQTRHITVYHLRRYIAKEKERGISDSTLEGYREIFSAYFNWLQRETLIDKNPAANLGPIKCPKKAKKIYSDVDIEKLKQHCTNKRDRALIAFLSATGCRVSEVMELNRDQVDLQELQCVVHGKGDKERMVFLDAVTGMQLREYLDSRTDDCDALFVGKGGRRLQPNGVRVMLKKLAEKAEVDHVHPHKFRRTLATNLTRHGMPIQEVASILGHEKLDTTMKYVVLNNQDTKNAYMRYR